MLPYQFIHCTIGDVYSFSVAITCPQSVNCCISVSVLEIAKNLRATHTGLAGKRVPKSMTEEIKNVLGGCVRFSDVQPSLLTHHYDLTAKAFVTAKRGTGEAIKTYYCKNK